MTAVLEQSSKINLTCIDSAARFIDAKTYTVTYQMFSMPGEEVDDIISLSQYQNSAFLKINYFLTKVLDNSVAFVLEDMKHAEGWLAEYDNNLLIMPDLDDMTLLEVIHRKLQTIAGDYSCVSKLSLYDHDTELTYHGYYNEDERKYNLPEQADWCGPLSYWETPWWDRYDIMTFDNIAESQEDIDGHKATADFDSLSQAFNDIDNNIDDMLRRIANGIIVDDDKEFKGPAEVVSLDSAKKKKEAKWTPKIV